MLFDDKFNFNFPQLVIFSADTESLRLQKLQCGEHLPRSQQLLDKNNELPYEIRWLVHTFYYLKITNPQCKNSSCIILHSFTAFSVNVIHL